DRERVSAAVCGAIKARRSFSIEDRVARKNGSALFVQARGSVLVDDTGDAVRVIGTCQDVTERKTAELAQARLAAIVEWSDDAIIANTRGGVIESANLGAARMYGYDNTELVGRPVSVLVPPNLFDELGRTLACVRRGEHVAAFEIVGLRK